MMKIGFKGFLTPLDVGRMVYLWLWGPREDRPAWLVIQSHIIWFRLTSVYTQVLSVLQFSLEVNAMGLQSRRRLLNFLDIGRVVYYISTKFVLHTV